MPSRDGTAMAGSGMPPGRAATTAAAVTAVAMAPATAAAMAEGAAAAVAAGIEWSSHLATEIMYLPCAEFFISSLSLHIFTN
jgi:hypothetical protein